MQFRNEYFLYNHVLSCACRYHNVLGGASNVLGGACRTKVDISLVQHTKFWLCARIKAWNLGVWKTARTYLDHLSTGRRNCTELLANEKAKKLYQKLKWSDAKIRKPKEDITCHEVCGLPIFALSVQLVALARFHYSKCQHIPSHQPDLTNLLSVRLIASARFCFSVCQYTSSHQPDSASLVQTSAADLQHTISTVVGISFRTGTNSSIPMEWFCTTKYYRIHTRLLDWNRA